MATTPEEILERGFWGWQERDDWPEGGREAFRAPLPPTPDHPVVTRRCGNIDGVTEIPIPPYIAAAVERGVLHVDIYGGSGWRAGYDPEAGEESEFIYADGDLPEEWVEPVAAAMEEIRTHWPDMEPAFRPSLWPVP